MKYHIFKTVWKDFRVAYCFVLSGLRSHKLYNSDYLPMAGMHMTIVKAQLISHLPKQKIRTVAVRLTSYENLQFEICVLYITTSWVYKSIFRLAGFKGS